MTIMELVQKLTEYPPDAIVSAYEGEVEAVVISDQNTHEQLGFIETKEDE